MTLVVGGGRFLQLNISESPEIFIFLWYLQNKLKTIKQRPLRPSHLPSNPPLLSPSIRSSKGSLFRPRQGLNSQQVPAREPGQLELGHHQQQGVHSLFWGQVLPQGHKNLTWPKLFPDASRLLGIHPAWSELQQSPHLPTQKSRKIMSRISSVPPPPVRWARCPRATRSASAARDTSLACL